MNKENKKMAQEKRAAERKKQENMKIVKKVSLAALVVVIFVGLIIYGVMDSAKQKEAGNAADTTGTEEATNIQPENTTETGLDTDTNRAVEMGDTVAIHYAGHVGEIYFQGGTGDYDLVIGSHSFIDDFEDQLVGHKIGEEVEVNVTFPEGYGGTYTDADGETQSLSNVDATFEVTINGIYK